MSVLACHVLRTARVPSHTRTSASTLALTEIAEAGRTYVGRGDDTVGIPHRAQIVPFEFSSLSSFGN